MFFTSNFLKRVWGLILVPLLNIIKWKNLFYTPSSDIVVIISFHKIGDTVHTIPAVRILAGQHSAQIKILCYPESKKVYELEFKGADIIPVEPENFIANRLAKPSARILLKKLKPKIIYDLTGTILSASLIAGQKSEKVFGLAEKPYTRLYSNFVLNEKKVHLVDLYINAVKTGYNSEIFSAHIKNHIPNIESNRILIHPFAGWKAKEWNLKKYIGLAHELNNEFACSLIFQRGLIPGDIILELARLNIPVIETGDLDELIREIKNCFLFIGNDSGPLYIASLLGIPTFTIYGPTNPLYSVPAGEYNRYIRKELKCSPMSNEQYCFTHAGLFGCPSFECMNQLSFDIVLNKIKDLINCIKAEKIN